VPNDAATQEQSAGYLRSWDALGKMLEEGKSWSGRERNMAYLNTADGHFTDVSTIVGFAFPSDSRALGFTDWDGDGDLDVWQANRSAPRLRYLQNQLGTSTRFLKLQLTGKTCNRDAIGARVSLTLTNGKRLIKTLRAGEGYLSQSSKIVHFGLPEGQTITSTNVRWPGGAEETFPNLRPGQTYHLTQGGSAQALTAAGTSLAALAAPESPVSSSNIRLIPHAKLPLPELPYTLANSTTSDASAVSQPTLVVLWASWCQPCLHEIQALSQSSSQLKTAGLQVVLINIEDDPHTAPNAPPTFTQGSASQAFLEAFDVTQRILVGRERETALPSSFLVDTRGRLLALYKGPLSPEVVMQDMALMKVTDGEFRNHSIPTPGRWLITAMPTDHMAIPTRLLEIRQTTTAFRFLERHITGTAPPQSASELPSITLTMAGVSQVYEQVAAQFIQQNETTLGKQALIRSLQYQSSRLEPREQLAMLYEKLGDHGNASTQYREVLKLQPEHLPARNSLAWILATATDPNVRAPAEAERLASEVCQRTKHTMAEPLDCLAAAQAATGKFAEAIATAQRGLQIAQESGDASVVQRIQERLALYRQGKVFVQPAF
jgi:thiol-disulfide isomerase/thioredoxin/Tfp pilus assembly protein PilF